MKGIRSLSTFVLLAFSYLASAAVISVTNDEFERIDNAFSFKNFVFDEAVFGGDDVITDISVSITFSKCNFQVSESGCIASGGQSFPFTQEIGLALISPDGESVSLIENDGGNESFEIGSNATFEIGNGNFSLVTIIFSDIGQALSSDISDVVAAGSNEFAPEGSLTSLIGLSGVGEWQLFVEDDSSSDPLGFHSATLSITTAGLQVNAPAILTIVGLGMLILILRKENNT